MPLGQLQLRPSQWAVSYWLPPTLHRDEQVLLEERFVKPYCLGTTCFGYTCVSPSSVESYSVELLGCVNTWMGRLPPTRVSDTQRMLGCARTDQHINELEMLAVFKALQEGCHALQDLPVLILSDNATVVACISKQGGTKSETLCNLAIDIGSPLIIKGSSYKPDIPGRLNVLADGYRGTGFRHRVNFVTGDVQVAASTIFPHHLRPFCNSLQQSA